MFFPIPEIDPDSTAEQRSGGRDELCHKQELDEIINCNRITALSFHFSLSLEVWLGWGRVAALLWSHFKALNWRSFGCAGVLPWQVRQASSPRAGGAAPAPGTWGSVPLPQGCPSRGTWGRVGSARAATALGSPAAPRQSCKATLASEKLLLF